MTKDAILQWLLSKNTLYESLFSFKNTHQVLEEVQSNKKILPDGDTPSVCR